ncbi:ATP-binding protein [Sulfurimonas sp.]
MINLKLKAENRVSRYRATLTKMAGFPTIKTLEQFDFDFTVGVNRRQIEELSTLVLQEHFLASLTAVSKAKREYYSAWTIWCWKNTSCYRIGICNNTKRIKARFITASDLIIQMSHA